MKIVSICVAVLLAGSVFADPQLTSWYTANAGQYARIRAATGAAPVTTWTGQTTPAYSDVELVCYSATNVYVYASGLASHIMGPWYLNAAKTILFPNKPVNQKITVRLTRTPVPATTHANTTGGSIGMFVDGVAMFNMTDAYTYKNSTAVDTQMGGDNIWERDAYFGELPSFDPNNAHQPGSGQYHAHINPLALRYQLNDNATYTAATDTYSEYTNNLHHSPIIGWAYDGYPIYGPYGYSITNNPNSAVRRMQSGFIKRNGQFGTTNLDVTGRTSLPLWAQISQNRATLTTGQYGPATTKTADMTGTFTIGRYGEDYDHLGDLPPASTVGAQWDLDRYNGRRCVTPDYPQGTYAYFVTITTNGAPTFPYFIGRQYYGVVNGGVASISEPVTTNFTGGANATLKAKTFGSSGSGDVTLTWSSVEGGTYVVSSSPDLAAWSDLVPAVSATSTVSQATEFGATTSYTNRFYKVRRSTLASYDP